MSWLSWQNPKKQHLPNKLSTLLLTLTVFWLFLFFSRKMFSILEKLPFAFLLQNTLIFPEIFTISTLTGFNLDSPYATIWILKELGKMILIIIWLSGSILTKWSTPRTPHRLTMIQMCTSLPASFVELPYHGGLQHRKYRHGHRCQGFQLHPQCQCIRLSNWSAQVLCMFSLLHLPSWYKRLLTYQQLSAELINLTSFSNSPLFPPGNLSKIFIL